MGWSEEDEEEGSEEGEEEEEGSEEGEEEEGGEESEEEEIEFKLPPALQRQFLASDDEEPEKQQTGIYVSHWLVIFTPSLGISDRAWGRKKKTFYAVEGESYKW